MDLGSALTHSCNVYFLTAVSQSPYRIYRQLVRTWHINEGTGMSLPGDPELPSLPIKELTAFQAAAACIGEGGAIRVSPLKAAQTFAALLEGTPLLRPYKKNGRPEEQYPLRVSPATSDFLRSTLLRVTTQGTLKGLNSPPGIKLLGGKTGTGTHFRKKFRTHGWNVIYVSINNKTRVIVTFVYRGCGSREARELSESVIRCLGKNGREM